MAVSPCAVTCAPVRPADPVDAFLRVAEASLDLGPPEKDLRRIVHDDPRELLALDG